MIPARPMHYFGIASIALPLLLAVITSPSLAQDNCTDLPFQEPLSTRSGTPSGFGKWGAWMDTHVRDGVLTSTLKDELDPNHVDGFGALQLVGYVYLNGKIDLRDAVLSFDVGGQGFKANDAGFYVWVQGCRSGEEQGPTGFVCSNWALSSQPLTDRLEDGEMHHVEVMLRDNEHWWSYGGNSLAQGEWGLRYRYLPLTRILAEPVNLHFVLALAPGGTPATGAVKLSNVRICTEVKPAPGLPEIKSVSLDGGDVRLRINAAGHPSNLKIDQDGKVIKSLYVGASDYDRDVFLHNLPIGMCGEVTARLVNEIGEAEAKVAGAETEAQRQACVRAASSETSRHEDE